MHLNKKGVAAAATITSVLAFGGAPGLAQASKNCGHMRVSGNGQRNRVSVKVKKGHVSCHEARRVARAILSTNRARAFGDF